MVFGAGRFAPGTHEGRRLIAHELTHIVQQSGSAVAVQRAPTPTADPSAERAAAVAEAEVYFGDTSGEQREVQSEAEDALKLDGRKRNDKSYAWSLGLKDRARTKKSWKLSPKLQQELTVKVRFFKGEARGAYLRTIGPALDEIPGEQLIEILAEPPSTEKSCPIGQTILVYQGKPGQGRCLTENDPEFQQNYIDNNIVRAVGLAIPNTTWENVDRNRVPQMLLTYKDGRTLVVDVKDIPIGVSLRRRQTMGATLSLRYEKRSDGFIYPIRGISDYVSYGDAENIVSLGAGLYDPIEELKTGFKLIELVVVFGGPRGPIHSLGEFAAMLGHPGGLFEPVPRKKTQTAEQHKMREVARKLIGKFKKAKNYHGDTEHDMKDSIVRGIMSEPEGIYITQNGRTLVFHKGRDLAIVEATGSAKGNIITAYGSSGIKGKTGASNNVYGGLPTDPGVAVTPEMILEGKIPKPDGAFFPPATKIWPSE